LFYEIRGKVIFNMPKIGPIKRKNLIHYLRRLGFDGPFASGNHELMLRGSSRVILPNPHKSDIGKAFLQKILKQAGISKEEWEKF
jgi:predicted RNA binding protein YcfA (HicA-like mRNA interferase family)